MVGGRSLRRWDHWLAGEKHLFAFDPVVGDGVLAFPRHEPISDWILDQNLGWVGFLLVVNILLLLAGNFMDASSIILIMAPTLSPAARKLGIDPVHFGIVIDVNMEVGLCHPPVGLNLYVASMIARMSITELAVAVWPWLLTMVAFLIVVTYWSGLTLVMPRLAGMM